MNYTRDVERIDYISSQAKKLAWGERLTPINARRRVRATLYDLYCE